MIIDGGNDSDGDMAMAAIDNLQKLVSMYVFMAVNSFRVSQEARVPLISLHFSPAQTYNNIRTSADWTNRCCKLYLE